MSDIIETGPSDFQFLARAADCDLQAAVEKAYPDAMPSGGRLGYDMGDCPSAWSSNGIPFYCTRQDGHDGPHVACGFTAPMAWWPNEKEASRG